MKLRQTPFIVALLVPFIASFADAEQTPVPRPNPFARSAPPQDGVTDLRGAIPATALSVLPPTQTQFQALKLEIAKSQPEVATARRTSEQLARQAAALQKKLVATAAHVEALEQEKVQLDAEIARLAAENATLSASFARDRISVSRLLAILERLQVDTPPALALRPDDALSAARGAMLVGASLPSVYGDAAALARRIDALRQTRLALVRRLALAEANTAHLAQAHIELDQLLAMKQLQAEDAASRYGDLRKALGAIAGQAADLQVLLEKVAAIRGSAVSQSVVTVTAQKGAAGAQPGRDSLVRPVVGDPVPGGMEGVGGSAAPGLTYAAAPGAQVISPADATVLFAGPYHKSGQVLILQLADGYDAVLAGLGRLEVRPEDHVLAGEPVGTMSNVGQGARLYFELRQNGRGVNPAPYIGVASRKAKKS